MLVPRSKFLLRSEVKRCRSWLQAPANGTTRLMTRQIHQRGAEQKKRVQPKVSDHLHLPRGGEKQRPGEENGTKNQRWKKKEYLAKSDAASKTITSSRSQKSEVKKKTPPDQACNGAKNLGAASSSWMQTPTLSWGSHLPWQSVVPGQQSPESDADPARVPASARAWSLSGLHWLHLHWL